VRQGLHWADGPFRGHQVKGASTAHQTRRPDKSPVAEHSIDHNSSLLTTKTGYMDRSVRDTLRSNSTLMEISYRLPENFRNITQVHLARAVLTLNNPPRSSRAMEFRFTVGPFNKSTQLPATPLLYPTSIWYFILTLPFSHSISLHVVSVASYC
jgi:hypothetical protein